MYRNGVSLYFTVDLLVVKIIFHAEEKNKCYRCYIFFVTCVTSKNRKGMFDNISYPTSQNLLIGPKYEIKTKKGPVAPF